jgi:hypothetical protein
LARSVSINFLILTSGATELDLKKRSPRSQIFFFQTPVAASVINTIQIFMNCSTKSHF